MGRDKQERHVNISLEGNVPREDDAMSVMSKTTVGSHGGRRKKVKHFNLQNLNRYGTIESTYLSEKNKEERKEITHKSIKPETHFITTNEVTSIKKALRIQVTEDWEGVPDAIASIKMKRCCTYIPADDSENAKCECGRAKSDKGHTIQYVYGKKHWRSSKHTSETRSTTWGKVSLAGCQSNFVRLSNMTGISEIYRLMTDVYKMKNPGLIVSLLGSIRNLKMPEKLENVIERDLSKAAAACDAWVTTPGLNSGICSLLGNGVRTYGLSLYTIGFPAWGSLTPRVRRRLEDLTNDMGNPISYPTKIDDNSVSHLEQNHTTFLLVDNGQIAETNEPKDDMIRAALEYRVNFENYMRDTVGVPVISIVSKGGIRTAHIVKERLENNDPVIVLAKSGGVASILFRTVNHMIKVESALGTKKRAALRILGKNVDYTPDTDDNENCLCVKNNGFTIDCEYLKRKVRKHLNLGKATDEQLKEVMPFVGRCLINRDMVFIYNMRDNASFDKLLLDAMVEHGSENIPRTLKYAFELNTVEVVEIMLNDISKDKLRSQTITLLIIKAIVMNRPHMVKLFLNTCTKDQLFNIKMNMPVLYDSCLYCYGGSHLVRLITYYVDDEVTPASRTLGIFHNSQIEEIDGADNVDEIPPIPPDSGGMQWDPSAMKMIDKIINELAGQSFDSSVSYEEDPYLELTIWSVLMLRKEMALLFCKRAEEPIRCALLSMKLMTQMEKRKNILVNSEEDEKLVEMKDAFESLAICTLETCYHENPEMTFAAARSKWIRMKNYDYLELAYEAECKRFLAHPACQDISEKRWRVGFVKDEGFWKVLLICLFPPLILLPGLVEFDTFANRHQDNTPRAWWDKIFVRLKIIGKSPMIKFWMNAVFSLAFIMLHLRVLYMDTQPLFDSKIYSYSWPLMYLQLAWFCLLVFDEAIQVYREKPFYWWKNVWNRVDLFMYILLCAGLILCLGFICNDTVNCAITPMNDTTTILTERGKMTCTEAASCSSDDAILVHAGRMMLSVVTIFLFLRFSFFITSDLTLGPIVLMMIEMTSTFANFFVIFCLVMVGFGAAYIGLLVEVGTFSPSRNLVGMVYYTYFQSLGELFLDVLENPDQSYYLNDNPLNADKPWFQVNNINAGYYWVCWVLLVVFMIISNLMLLNILIAMFTESYESISENQKIIWKFQRYSLMRDYEQKFLPTPLNVLHYTLSICRRAWKIKHPKKEYVNPLKKSIDKHLRAFVKECLQIYVKIVGDEDLNEVATRYAKYVKHLS